MTPNVETVATNGWVWMHSQRTGLDREHTMRFIEAVGKVKSVKRLEVMERWSEPLVKGISENSPTCDLY